MAKQVLGGTGPPHSKRQFGLRTEWRRRSLDSQRPNVLRPRVFSVFASFEANHGRCRKTWKGKN